MPAIVNQSSRHVCFSRISRIIFFGALLFLLLFVLAITFGQAAPYEFKSRGIASRVYSIIFQGIPLAVLLTLFESLRWAKDLFTRIAILVATISVSILSFLFIVNSMFTVGFGAWTTLTVLYEHRSDPERQIRLQEYDLGALGYGGRRVVEVAPVAGLFWKVAAVDSNTVDKAKWLRVDREGDLK